MNRIAVVAAVASLTFIAGVAAGLFLGAPRARILVPADTRPSVEFSSAGGTRPAESEPQPATAAKSTGDSEPTAQELWEIVTAPETSTATYGPRVIRQPNRRAVLRKLRPEMADFFIRRYRECENAMDSSQQWAMEMAIACGGPKAVDFVEELARMPIETHMSFRYRSAVSSVLIDGHLAPRPREFPVTESLLNQSQVLLAASPAEDRKLALAILGFVPPARSIPTLSSVFRSDPDPHVRETALKQLGRLGDATMLNWLRGNADSLAKELQALYKPVQSGDEVMIMSADHAARALKDAIEELEERLQPK